MPAKRSRPPTVCILAPPESSAGTIYGLYEVFSMFGPVWVELTGEDTFNADFDVRIVARSREAVECIGGAIVAPHAALSDVANADIAIVPDLTIDPDTDRRGQWPDFVSWLQGVRAAGGMICSACNGSLVLANAGLLDGRPATTHWGFVNHFRRFYPQVILEPNRILVTATPDGRVVSAGGMSSWQDLALFVVARFYGEAAAIKAAKVFLFGDRSDGQLPYAAAVKPNRHEDAVIAQCQTWIADNYETSNPVAQMAARSGLTSRTFKRRFKAATGFAPLDYVQMLRIEEAKQMLETTEDPIEAIARQVGYEDPTSFRRLFKRVSGVTPGRYRRRYMSIAKAVRPAPPPRTV